MGGLSVGEIRESKKWIFLSKLKAKEVLAEKPDIYFSRKLFFS